MPRQAVYCLALTPHQRAALMTVVADYIASGTGVDVSIDAHTGAELPIGDLLALLINAQPTVTDSEES